ncbi:MAG: Permease of the drug/metabolite transporter (DMT) superfamily [Chloroflexi bacterium]|jgi:drug/metabolite transporter (DMT)-like permease|nr:MAG: Permease of the drug/metabolite transporter (DMT) superfamily [Chloroflexota bacterium]
MLVLFSGVLHASWNLMLKRSHNQEVFAWWLQIAQIFLFAPLAIFLLGADSIENPGWWFVVGTSLIHMLYFVFLSRSYSHGDLSLVYPLARGTGPALVPVLGVALLGEEVTVLASFGIVLVVGGIFTSSWWGKGLGIARNPMRLLTDPGIRYALLTGLTIASYSVWDKMGVQFVNPLLYMYLLAAGAASGLAPYMVWKHGVSAMRKELRLNLGPIVVAGILAFVAYAAVLSALQVSSVSYVSPSREVGIVFSVLLGALILKEPVTTGRIAGSVVILLGVFLIALG